MVSVGRCPGIFDGCNKTHPDISHAVVLDGYGEETHGIRLFSPTPMLAVGIHMYVPSSCYMSFDR